MPKLTVITVLVFACFLVARSRIALERAFLVGRLWKTCALSQEREHLLQLDLLAVELACDPKDESQSLQEQIDDAFDAGLYAREQLEEMGENDA